MDLEELGNLLNQATGYHGELIGRTIQPDKKRPGVFTDIKIRLRWILGIFAGCSLIFLPAIFSHQAGSLFLLLYLILSIESVISMIAWFQIRSIEKTTGDIRQRLIQRIRALHLLFSSYIYLNAFMYFLLVFMVEYSLHHPGYIYLQEFAVLPLAIRLLIYLSFLSFQYFTKKKSFEKYYGDYLNNLTKILNQTREGE